MAIISGCLHIYFDKQNNMSATYIFKPLTLILIILIAFYNESQFEPAFKYLVIIGLMFSLAGDIFLMFKKKDYFIQGLFAFLLGHLFYLTAVIWEIGFSINIVSVIPFLMLAITTIMILRSKAGKKRNYITIYSIIIFILLWQATDRALFSLSANSILFAIGILFFTFSDYLLAHNKFIRQFKYAQIFILGTYYTAQILIATSI